MKLSTWIGCAAFAVAHFAVLPAHADGTIVIVRHGEKPSEGLGQLTCQGLNRSLALAPLLLSRYGAPLAVYAPNPSILKQDHGVAYSYVRPLATIEPLAIRAGLPVNVQWGMTQIEPLAARMLAAPDALHVVAWEHHWAESLARHLLSKLGAEAGGVPKWADDDFDSVYVVRITHDKSGKKDVLRAAFTHEHQGLDGLPTACVDLPRSDLKPAQ